MDANEIRETAKKYIKVSDPEEVTWIVLEELGRRWGVSFTVGTSLVAHYEGFHSEDGVNGYIDGLKALASAVGKPAVITFVYARSVEVDPGPGEEVHPSRGGLTWPRKED